MIHADMKVTGRFDGMFAVGARPLFDKLAGEAHDIGIDLSEAIDLDAGGLAELVKLHKRLEPRGCKVRVLGANDTLLRLFEKFQIADLFIEGAAIPANTALRNCFFGVPAPVAPANGIRGATAPRREVPPAFPVALRDGGSKGISEAAPLDTARRSVTAWLDASAIAGAGIRGGEALKSYKRYAVSLAAEFDAAKLRRILTLILGADRVVSRTSGYVVKGLQLLARHRPDSLHSFGI